MTVLSTAEHAAPDTVVDAVCRAVWIGHPNNDLRVVDIGNLIIPAIRIISGDGVHTNALTAAEHIAVFAVQGDGDVVALFHSWCRTHLSAPDGHLGIAGAFNRLHVEDGVIVFRVFIGNDDGIRHSQAH